MHVVTKYLSERQYKILSQRKPLRFHLNHTILILKPRMKDHKVRMKILAYKARIKELSNKLLKKKGGSSVETQS